MGVQSWDQHVLCPQEMYHLRGVTGIPSTVKSGQAINVWTHKIRELWLSIERFCDKVGVLHEWPNKQRIWEIGILSTSGQQKGDKQ